MSDIYSDTEIGFFTREQLTNGIEVEVNNSILLKFGLSEF